MLSQLLINKYLGELATLRKVSGTRTDIPDEKARAASQSPKAMLKADKDVAKALSAKELEALFDKWCAAERAPRDGSLGGYAA